MLNGVGGRTVAEAKENLTVTEVRRWIAYIKKYGSLNLARRVAEGSGLVAFTISRVNGGKAELEDFIPHYSQQVLESPHEALALLKKGATHVQKPRNAND